MAEDGGDGRMCVVLLFITAFIRLALILSLRFYNLGAFIYTNYTGTLVWAHLRFGRQIWSRKSCWWKPQLILEGWKYIWTMCGNGIGKVIAHRRNNEAARCPKAYDLLR